MEETPSPERVLAGDSLHYDGEGKACALCVKCMKPIDLEFGDYVEVGVTEKRGLGMERTGGRWYMCAGCADDAA